MTRWWALALACAACGGVLAGADLQQAHLAAYRGDFQTVWRAVREEAHQLFPEQVAKEDGDKGILNTEWMIDAPSGKVKRVAVWVTGNPPRGPWHVEIQDEVVPDGEAPPASQPSHSDDLKRLADQLTVGVYRRLKDIAVEDSPVKGHPSGLVPQR